jgi:hypothetical protein
VQNAVEKIWNKEGENKERLENKKNKELHSLYYTPYSIHHIKPRVTICAGHIAFVVFSGKCTQIACDKPRRTRDLGKPRLHSSKSRL